jgi:hypothetical protein
MFGLENRLLVRGYTVLEIELTNDFATTTMAIHYLLYITFEVVLLSISTLLAAISVLLSSFEDISSILFELASDFYGVPPRASFPTEKCAILILGAQEGASLIPSTAITYPRTPPPLRCGKKRGVVILPAGLYRLCAMSKSKRRVWTPSTI